MNAAPGEPSVLMQFVPILFLFGVMYFMIIRPQQKKTKEHANMITKLQKNDEVVTVGGVHGTVVAVNDKTLSLRIADNVKVEIEKSSIASVKK